MDSCLTPHGPHGAGNSARPAPSGVTRPLCATAASPRGTEVTAPAAHSPFHGFRDGSAGDFGQGSGSRRKTPSPGRGRPRALSSDPQATPAESSLGPPGPPHLWGFLPRIKSGVGGHPNPLRGDDRLSRKLTSIRLSEPLPGSIAGFGSGLSLSRLRSPSQSFSQRPSAYGREHRNPDPDALVAIFLLPACSPRHLRASAVRPAPFELPSPLLADELAELDAVGGEELGDAGVVDVGDDDLAHLRLDLAEDAVALHLGRLVLVVLGGGDVVN